MTFTPLHGKRITLIPLESEHADALFHCSRFPDIWEHLPINIQSIKEMEEHVQEALAGRERGDEFPYVVFDKQLNQIVGMTRYLRISPLHNSLNIGWTWYCPEVWRSPLNTECKYLLLKYAFEVWEAVRVEIFTTSTHRRSQQAIERLGAIREGVLRKKFNGLDYVIFSVIDENWSVVKNRHESFLDYQNGL
ncbi:GNAT family N-acetyltransferase [Paenibacillus sp. L3-i20]|uniref:GNAT family N-acetyltransferase n=1 Tax=Paenibacillus sp. L3-i20 TaxID=2905833 RepID=UPI001EDEB22A|nr:GNAT family protein [Paenibacillus sp. L3-i20]GKU78059.1 N-acetyltransferase [Paenibacillus sp. L3-i20]